MTIAAIALIVIAVLYCVWHKGTDWPAILIGASLGVALAGSAFGQAIKTIWNAGGSAVAEIFTNLS